MLGKNRWSTAELKAKAEGWEEKREWEVISEHRERESLGIGALPGRVRHWHHVKHLGTSLTMSLDVEQSLLPLIFHLHGVKRNIMSHFSVI